MSIEFNHIYSTVLKNDEMDIYEKMCLLILLGIEDAKLTSEELGNLMGCSTIRARLAFESLQEKGYLKGEPQPGKIERVDRRDSNVLSSNENTSVIGDISEPLKVETEEFLEGFFKPAEEEKASFLGNAENFIESQLGISEKTTNHKDIDPEKERRQRLAAYLLGEGELTVEEMKPFVSVKETKQSLVDQVIEIIDEKISFKEANIILGFAKNDLDLIRRKYKTAKLSQMSDTISVLINELQKKESTVIKAEKTDSEKTQIDTNRILKMQAYKNQRG